MVESAHTSQTPSQGNVNNGSQVTTADAYVFAAVGTVSAIRFWAPTTNSGTYTCELWRIDSDDNPAGTGTGTLLASAAVASGSVTADTWNRVAITPQAVDTSHAYAAAVHATSGRFVQTAGAFNAAGITNGNVTAIRSGTDPVGLGVLRNGRFSAGAAGAYPASNSGQPDYFVDVEFGTGQTITGTGLAELGVLAATAAGLRTVLGVGLANLGALVATAVQTPQGQGQPIRSGTRSAPITSAAAGPPFTSSTGGLL